MCQSCPTDCSAGDNVVLLDINANEAGGTQMLGQLQVDYGQLIEEYQEFSVPFNNAESVITLEFRAWYQGTVGIAIDKVTVE